MSPPRPNAGSVLGKRSHQTTQVDSADPTPSLDLQGTLVLPTPDATPNPKRAKTTGSVLDGDHNKENIPPFVVEAINASTPPSPRLTRSLRRTSTMVHDGSSRQATPRRYASTSNLRQAAATPATSLSLLSLATPPATPPSLLLPLHVRARALLRPTCNDGPQMAGRQQERSEIKAFILGFIDDTSSPKDSSALYISGSPGTGKTALVNSTLADLASQLTDIQMLSVNCMALDGVDAVWQRLAEMLGKCVNKSPGRARKSKDSPQQIVEKALGSNKQRCILVLDEMDHIASSTQALSPLFTLAHTFSSNLRLIGIANTHTLTSSSSTAVSVQSLAGVQTLHFAPYTPEQLLGILQARLAPLLEDKEILERTKKFLPTPTLTLLSKKIAAQTGDVRAVFEVLRGAIDLAVIASPSTDPLNAPPPVVTPSHILSALKAYAPAGKTTPASAPSAAAGVARKASDSETVTKVRELGLQQRLVLLAALLAAKASDAGVPISASPVSSPSRSPIKRTQSSSAVHVKSAAHDVGQLHAFYSTILGRTESGVFNPVSRSEFGDLAGVLEVVGLFALTGSGSLPTTPRKAGKKGFSRSASFAGTGGAQEVRFVEGVRLDEVARGLGLGLDDTPANVREEEVRAIYQREQARIAREAKAHGHVPAELVGFDEAMED